MKVEKNTKKETIPILECRIKAIRSQVSQMRRQSTTMFDEADRLDREADAIQHGINAIKQGSMTALNIMSQVVESHLSEADKRIIDALRDCTSDGVATVMLPEICKVAQMPPQKARRALNKLWSIGYMKPAGFDQRGNARYKISGMAMAE